jgi:phenylalanine-4-hydroxylase
MKTIKATNNDAQAWWRSACAQVREIWPAESRGIFLDCVKSVDLPDDAADRFLAIAQTLPGYAAVPFTVEACGIES